MNNYLQRTKCKLFYRLTSIFVAITFISSSIVPPSYAQFIPQSALTLPAPGTMVPLSVGFTPALIKGITIHPDNPLEFDFIVNEGDNELSDTRLREEAYKMIKYFLTSLTVPEEEQWVNLSPYEKDRIIPQRLGETEMGRDLLAQDYLLKQLTASLIYPEDELGQKFWDRVYAKAQKQFGTTDLPLNTFNKVWIVPEKAVIYEHENTAFVVSSHLKVMLQEDYAALEANKNNPAFGLNAPSVLGQEKVISDVSSEVVREVLIPEIEKEINGGENFANLRQVYNSMILATWYKMNLKESLLGQVYVDQNKIVGIDLENKNVKQEIYDQYIEAFSKGVYNYIREEYDPATQEIVPRKYFSGGFARETAAVTDPIITVVSDLGELSAADRVAASSAMYDDGNVEVEAEVVGLGQDANIRLAIAWAEDTSLRAAASSPIEGVRTGFEVPEGQGAKIFTHSFASHNIRDILLAKVTMISTEVVEAVEASLGVAVQEGKIISYDVKDYGGSDIDIHVTHRFGENNASVRLVMLNALKAGLVKAEEIGQLNSLKISNVADLSIVAIRAMLPIQAQDHTITQRGSESVGIAKGVGVSPSAANAILIHQFAMLGSVPGQKLAHLKTPGFRFRLQRIEDILGNEENAKEWELEISMERLIADGGTGQSVYDGIQLLTLAGQPSDYVITAVYGVEGAKAALNPSEPLASVMYKPVGGIKDRQKNLNVTILYRLQSGAEAVGGIGTLVEDVHVVPGGPTGENFVATMPVTLEQARTRPPKGIGYFTYWGYQSGQVGKIPIKLQREDHISMNPLAVKDDQRIARKLGRELSAHDIDQPYLAPWAARQRVESTREAHNALFVHAPKESEDDPFMRQLEDRVESGELIAITDDKADVGGTWGHTRVPAWVTAIMQASLQEAIESGEITDGNTFGSLGVSRLTGSDEDYIGVGDDAHMIMVGDTSRNSLAGHKFSMKTFVRAYLFGNDNPADLPAYGLGQDLAGFEAAIAMSAPYTFSEFTPSFFRHLREIMPQEYIDLGVIDRIEERWRRITSGAESEPALEEPFSGNVSGQGAGSARYLMDPRSEDTVDFIAGDKMGPAALNRLIKVAVYNAVDADDTAFENGLVFEIWDAKAFDPDGSIAAEDVPTHYYDVKYNFRLSEADIASLSPENQADYRRAKEFVDNRAYQNDELVDDLSADERSELARVLKKFGYVPTKRIFLDAQQDRAAIDLYLSDSDRFNVKYVWQKSQKAWDVTDPQASLDRLALGSSITRLGILTGGEYIGKDDPVMVGHTELMKHAQEYLRTQPLVVQGDMFGSHWVWGVPLPVNYAVATKSSHAIFSLIRYKLEDGKLVEVEDIGGDKSFNAIRDRAYTFNREFRVATLGGEIEPYGTHKDTVEASYGLARHLDELNREGSPYLLSTKRAAAEAAGTDRVFPQVPSRLMDQTYDTAVELSTASSPVLANSINGILDRIGLDKKLDKVYMNISERVKRLPVSISWRYSTSRGDRVEITEIQKSGITVFIYVIFDRDHATVQDFKKAVSGNNFLNSQNSETQLVDMIKYELGRGNEPTLGTGNTAGDMYKAILRKLLDALPTDGKYLWTVLDSTRTSLKAVYGGATPKGIKNERFAYKVIQNEGFAYYEDIPIVLNQMIVVVGTEHLATMITKELSNKKSGNFGSRYKPDILNELLRGLKQFESGRNYKNLLTVLNEAKLKLKDSAEIKFFYEEDLPTTVDRMIAAIRDVIGLPAVRSPVVIKTLIGVLAQRITRADKANTGELNGKAAIRAGANGAIAGHSEAREIFSDTDENVADQLLLAHELGLKDKIFAFGEPLNIRKQGKQEQYVESQILRGLALLSINQVADTIFAYEPIWAIGTDKTATPQQAQAMAKFVRKTIAKKYGKETANKVRILYGGSATADNAAKLIAKQDIDGFLVGGASNQVKDIKAIVRIVEFHGPTNDRIPYVGGNNKTKKIATGFYADVAEAFAYMHSSRRRVEVGFAPSVGLITEAANAFRSVASSPLEEETFKKGGIDLNSALLDLQIKRDGDGVPLPVFDQPMDLLMNIQGFLPVIINVTPVNVPLLLGLAETPDADTDFSFINDLDPTDRKARFEYEAFDEVSMLN